MKNKNVFFVCLTALTILAVNAACGFSIVQGSHHVVTETRSVQGFNRVSLLGSGDVILTQGDQEGLKVEAEDNLMRYIKTEVKGGRLTISIDGQGAIINTTEPVRYYLSMKEIKGLEVLGSGNIYSSSVTGSDLSLGIGGSGYIRIDALSATDLTSTINGSGNLNLADGKVTSQRVDVRGSGSYMANRLASETVSADVYGSGNVDVWTTATLDAHISGSGNVNYSGQPKLSVQSTGSGSVHQVEASK